MSDFSEIGTSGLSFYGDFLLEDSYQALFNEGKAKVYREMSTEDPLVSAALYAINTYLKDVSWDVKAASENREDEDAAEFLRSVMHDMSFSWGETVSENLSMLEYGWAFHEIIYKRRLGDNKDPSKNSRYEDGRIGWRKIPLRSQESLAGWVFDDAGGIQGMKQYSQGYKSVVIPIEKALLFRINTRKNNPEGVSILRGSVRAWHLKRNVELMEGIGLERDLAGFPVYDVPPDILSANPSPEELNMRNHVVETLKNVRANKAAYLLNPAVFDANSNKLYDFRLVTSGGRRQFDTSAIIARYNVQILMTMLADIIFLGHGDTGSYALGETKAEMLTRSLNHYTRTIAGTYNRFAVPRLFRLNGMRLATLPEITPSQIETIDLDKLGSFVQQAGLVMDDDLENALRQKAKLPEKMEEEGDDDE
jgi:hypothetical protein